MIEEAPETLQLNVELPPALTLVGLAVKELMTGFEGAGGGGAETTVTVTDLVTVPAALVAVMVYIVLEKGRALALPAG